MYFCNLTIKMKLHFNQSRFEVSNRATLLRYYDEFFSLSRFFVIKHTNLKQKSTRNKTNKRKTSHINVKEFNCFNDEMNMNETDENSKHDSFLFTKS